MKQIKIITLILSLFLFYGCGSGNIAETDKSGTKTEEQYGRVVFRIEVEKPNITEGAKQLFKIPADTSGIRVRAWDDTGHDVLTELPISSGTTILDAEVPLPAGTNYRLDAIAYRIQNQTARAWNKSILTVGRSAPFSIVANTTTSVSLTLDSYSISFNGTTTEVNGGEPVTIQATVTGPDLFFSDNTARAYLYAALEPWVEDGISPYPGVAYGMNIPNINKVVNGDGTVTSTILITFNAPVVITTQPMYYQISFYTNNNYRTDNIPFLYLPSLAAGEALGTITVKPPTGSVTVNLS